MKDFTIKYLSFLNLVFIIFMIGCARTVTSNSVQHHVSLKTIVEGIKQGKLFVNEDDEVSGNIYDFEMPVNIKDTMIVNGYEGSGTRESDLLYKYVDRKYSDIEKCVKIRNLENKNDTFFMDGYWAYEGVNNNAVICYTEGKRVTVKPGEVAELCIAACPDVLKIKEPVSYFGFAASVD